jgi:hypothetical protein
MVELTKHADVSRETVRRRLVEKTSSSRGARTCGASPRSMAPMLRAWRMCSTSMPRLPTRGARWCAFIAAPQRLRAQQMSHGPGECHPISAPSFTAKQGQYLAFIYAYTQIMGRPPAEADLQRHFRVTPPSVHQMILTLERAGLIRRQPGVARSITVLVDPRELPVLHGQTVRTSVQRY